MIVVITIITTKEVFYDKLTFIYLEMPKFNKRENELRDMFDKWLFVLRNLSRLMSRPEALQERVFTKLFEAAEIAKFTKEQYEANVKKAKEYISTNIVANILGLGWAATPSGLKAMEELQKDNPDKNTATNEMCSFLILNISSLQLIPINIIAYRSQYGSVNPSKILIPGLIATLGSTIVAVIYIKWKDRKR